MWQGIFSPRVSFQCRLSYSVHTPLCAISNINVCAHMKDPILLVRVGGLWKHTACIEGRVARLLQLAFPRESNPNFPWEKPQWDNTVVKKKKNCGSAGRKMLICHSALQAAVTHTDPQTCGPWSLVGGLIKVRSDLQTVLETMCLLR